jgi:hypothetical protein
MPVFKIRLTVAHGCDGGFQPGVSDPLLFPVT